MGTIPEGFTTVTPHLIIDGADAAIDLYQRAFGAELLGRMELPGNDDLVMHAMVRVGSGNIFLSDPNSFTTRKPPAGGPSPVAFYLYVEDVDGAYKRAVEAGMTPDMEPTDMFWGDRNAVVSDRFGYIWTIASHVRDVTMEEMQDAMAQMA